MLGVLLEALPKKRPLNKRREEGEGNNQSWNGEKKKNQSREDSLPNATGDLMFVYQSDGRSVLEWFHVLSCGGASYHYNHFMISSLMGCVRTVLLWHPAVLHWGQRSRLDESSRVEFQYSAAYSVPWSPLHSSVNSFTMSFTLRLFTRSLHNRGGSKENKHIKLYSINVTNHVAEQLNGLISKKGCKQMVTWVSDVRSCLSVQLWLAMMGTQEAAAPPSTTWRAEKSSACSNWKALLQTGPSGSEMPRLRCPGESGAEVWQQRLSDNKRGRNVWCVITQPSAA